MPFFKTTYNILTNSEEDELFNENWMDSNTLTLPPKINWDYKREMILEDVDIWEVIYQQSGGLGLYAAWSPYAEFYMITQDLFKIKNNSLEFFYGKKASEKAYKRAVQLGIPVHINKVWVEDDDLWLY
jgi:hypothetical protein